MLACYKEKLAAQYLDFLKKKIKGYKKPHDCVDLKDKGAKCFYKHSPAVILKLFPIVASCHNRNKFQEFFLVSFNIEQMPENNKGKLNEDKLVYFNCFKPCINNKHSIYGEKYI
ncbi:extracellular matrix protein 2 [Platysternon megacephalum]|uniref:Extracellular matrix protein 2 n=1 Tax=Platysternon megacephalum TaxID=55544 RepID=A0A4D9EHL4_9SAUR|nr:extracellular matrix protein 2 [Platysternon megacephalum]